VVDDDFYYKTNRFRIELTFEDLADNEAKNFTEWLGWSGQGENARPYLHLLYDVSRKNGKILPSDVHAGVDEEGYLLTAEARDYLKVTYLKPLRDAESEFIPKKNSRISQILQGHEAFKGQEESHHLVALFSKFNRSIEKYFEAKQPNTDGTDGFEDIADKKGKELKDKIDDFIHSLYDKNKDSLFTVSEGKLKNVLEKLELSIKNEINPGLGTLNRLFIASELLHLGKTNWDGVRLGLIEELEAHLHPQAQMQIIESLQEQKDIQLILTTHSPNLASKVKLENLIICNNNNAFPMGKEYTKLDEKDYSYLEVFLDTTKSNLFFAKGVILVEGWAEEILLPALSRKVGFNLTEKGVSVVNVSSTAFLRYAKIFQRLNPPEMKIPIAIVTDLDVKPEDEFTIVKDGKSKKELEIDNKKSKYDGQVVKTFVSQHWTFEYCLFKSTSLNSKFQEIVKNIHSGTDWTNFEKSLTEKLINKGLHKTEIAYQLAHFLEADSKKGTSEITINTNDTAIGYLIEAIKYACSN
ncbi:MAG: ATP-dependent nuclease, partial [Candidatus Humimicrobiaceae bacterium]